MASAQNEAGRGEPVQHFHATSGRFVGSLTLAAVAVILVYVAADARTLDGLRVASGSLFFAVVVWLALLRPRATAYRDVLHLQNSLRDVDVPLTLLDDVHVGRMLTVLAGEERFVCVGIGAPLRELVKGRRSGHGPAAWDRLEEYSHQATPPAGPAPQPTYAEFVEGQILSLAQDARRRSRIAGAASPERPRGEWAWSGILALVVTGLAFLVSVLL